MAGRTSILNTLFLSFDWTWRKSPRRFTTYDTMTLRCHSPARTYTYIISWSANLQLFWSEEAKLSVFHCFQHLSYLFGGNCRFNKGRKKPDIFPYHLASNERRRFNFSFLFFELYCIFWRIYIILSFSFGCVGWCIFVCSGFLSYIPYQFRGEKSISVPSYVRSSYFAFYSFM